MSCLSISLIRRSLVLLLFLSGLVLTACSASSPPVVETQAPRVQRVVALTSLSADIVHRLAPDKLVGMPESSLFKDNPKLKAIPKVSGGRVAPNLEKILSLKPDLVIGAERFHETTKTKLAELKIPCELFDVRDWQSLEALTRAIAEKVSADPQPLIEKYQAMRQNIPQNAPKTLVLVSRQPILSPNKNSWAGALLESFNIPNLAADLQGASPIQGYVSLSPESVLKANPEAIALVETPMPNSNILQEFSSQPFWQNLKAVKDKQIYVFDYYGLVNPSSIDAIESATQKLRQLANRQVS
jgi:iron complex transport system substrate-binding protein